MKPVIIIILLALIIAISCKKNQEIGNDEFVTLSYPQTYCSDPWPTGAGGNDSLTMVNVAHYLDSLDVYISGLTIKADNTPDTCKACTCKTGKTIYASTFKGQEEKYIAVGFTKE